MRVKPTKFELKEVQSKLSEIPGWSLRDGCLYRECSFPDFQHAFAFMTAAALVSEKMDHHPDWSNVYNKVIIKLITHECSGISERDFAWAKSIQGILKKFHST